MFGSQAFTEFVGLGHISTNSVMLGCLRQDTHAQDTALQSGSGGDNYDGQSLCQSYGRSVRCTLLYLSRLIEP